MVELTLWARTPLDGCHQRIGDSTITEITDLSIVSIAAPQQRSGSASESLNTRCEQACGLSLPAVGQIHRHDNALALMGMQHNQWLLVSNDQQQYGESALKHTFGPSAYLTDQSDSWVVLDIDGPATVAALERICTLDLAPKTFDEQRVARTVMEQLSVIIERPTPQRFRLYSPRSTAHSLLHAVSVSLRNVATIS